MADQPESAKFKDLQQRVAREMTDSADALTRRRHADIAIERFRHGVSGAGITLSQPAKPSDPHIPQSASLSERRDTDTLASRGSVGLGGPPATKASAGIDRAIHNENIESGDEARTGEDADRNRAELVKQAEKVLEQVRGELPHDQAEASDESPDRES